MEVNTYCSRVVSSATTLVGSPTRPANLAWAKPAARRLLNRHQVLPGDLINGLQRSGHEWRPLRGPSMMPRESSPVSGLNTRTTEVPSIEAKAKKIARSAPWSLAFLIDGRIERHFQ